LRYDSRDLPGVPGNHWRGFKITDDTCGPVIDPTTMEGEISNNKLAAARGYLGMRFPALTNAPLLESRVCQYENSTDHNFILDRHPEAENAWIVGGGSTWFQARPGDGRDGCRCGPGSEDAAYRNGSQPPTRKEYQLMSLIDIRY
jgi:glycine/D-amino acid oxidase-like deaminating enzyme